MNRMILLAMTALVCLSALLAACGDGDDGDGDSPPEVPDDRQVVEAPINDLNLITTGEVPTRYQVAITSGLPNGCAEFHDARIVGNTGTLITVSITNTVPKDENTPCDAVYRTHTSLLDLGSDYTTGTTYTVKVNTGEVKFTPD
jgi:hypothetical protein